MKVFRLILLMLFMQYNISAQIKSYLNKTKSNQVERTKLLDLLRQAAYTEFKQEFEFVILEFNVNSKYAWLAVNVQRKDGTKIVLDAAGYDCCHAEALFVKKNGRWFIEEHVFFSTDVWYAGIMNKYKNIPRQLFGSYYFAGIEN